MATIGFTETVKYESIDVSTDQLIELFRQYAPDVLDEVVGAALGGALTDRAPYEVETFGPVLDGLRALAVEQGIEPERDDIVGVTYED